MHARRPNLARGHPGAFACIRGARHVEIPADFVRRSHHSSNRLRAAVKAQERAIVHPAAIGEQDEGCHAQPGESCMQYRRPQVVVRVSHSHAQLHQAGWTLGNGDGARGPVWHTIACSQPCSPRCTTHPERMRALSKPRRQWPTANGAGTNAMLSQTATACVHAHTFVKEAPCVVGSWANRACPDQGVDGDPLCHHAQGRLALRLVEFTALGTMGIVLVLAQSLERAERAVGMSARLVPAWMTNRDRLGSLFQLVRAARGHDDKRGAVHVEEHEPKTHARTCAQAWQWVAAGREARRGAWAVGNFNKARQTRQGPHVRAVGPVYCK